MTRYTPWILTSAVAALAAVSPLTVSRSHGITVKAAACADGTCCSEPSSICFINGIRTDNAYYKGIGSCTPTTL